MFGSDSAFAEESRIGALLLGDDRSPAHGDRHRARRRRPMTPPRTVNRCTQPPPLRPPIRWAKPICSPTSVCSRAPAAGAVRAREGMLPSRHDGRDMPGPRLRRRGRRAARGMTARRGPSSAGTRPSCVGRWRSVRRARRRGGRGRSGRRGRVRPGRSRARGTAQRARKRPATRPRTPRSWRCAGPPRLVGGWRLDGCTLVVTLEPCTMCAGALVLARVSTLVFGAWEPKTGAVGSLWDVVRDRRLNHRPEVYGGVLEAECAALLRASSADLRRSGWPCADLGEMRVDRSLSTRIWPRSRGDRGGRRGVGSGGRGRWSSRAISTIWPKVCSRSCAEVVVSPVLMWSLTVSRVSARAR